MPKFTIWKTLSLEVEIDANSATEAIDAMLEMDDGSPAFAVVDCDHGVIVDGEHIDSYEIRRAAGEG